MGNKIIKKLIKTLSTSLLVAYALLDCNNNYLAISISDREVLMSMLSDYQTYHNNNYAFYYWRVLDNTKPNNDVMSETRFILCPDNVIISQPIHRIA